jgi:hypothetical protein
VAAGANKDFMLFTMQDILAILIVAFAAAFLLRRAWQRLARRSGGSCNSCSSCNSANSSKSHQLFTISPTMSHAKAQRREGIRS